MTFPQNIGMDTEGDQSGDAYSGDAATKVHWADILTRVQTVLNSVYDPATNSLNIGSGPTTITGLTKVKTTIHYDDPSPVAITTIPAGSILLDVVTVATTAWNGTATIDIGYAADPDAILPNTSITKTLNAVSGEDKTTRGVDLFSTNPKCKFYAAQKAVIATLASLGTTTTGVLDVYLIVAE